MSHRNKLHQFDAAAAEIRRSLQAATHDVTIVAGEAGGLFITCFPLKAEEPVAPVAGEIEENEAGEEAAEAESAPRRRRTKE